MNLPANEAAAANIDAFLGKCSWRYVLSFYLPDGLMDKIVGVYRCGDATSMIFIGYKVHDFDEPWLSDQFLARIALEAPT